MAQGGAGALTGPADDGPWAALLLEVGCYPREARALRAALAQMGSARSVGLGDLLVALVALAQGLDGPDPQDSRSASQRLVGDVPACAWDQWLPADSMILARGVPDAIDRALRDGR